MRRHRVIGLLIAAILLMVLARYFGNSVLTLMGIGVVLVGLWLFDRWLTKHETGTKPDSPDSPDP